ncbi:MAG TPA: PilZ domain-containing protein [Spirochaetota bacterium]|nr:PilZ domain-containing protein [Spirochaetota bacterium]
MNILVYEPISNLGNLIINALIPQGIKVKLVSSKQEIIPALKSVAFRVLISDCKKDDQELVNIIKAIKQNPLLARTHIVLHLQVADKKLLVTMIKLGVSGFITKPFHPQNFLAKLAALFKKYKINDTQNKRKYIRVMPKEGENVTATVRSAVNFKLVTMQVVNISLGGVLLRDPEGKNIANFRVKTPLKSIQIKLETGIIEVAGIILAVKKELLAVKFTAPGNDARDKISRYIYSHMQYDEEKTSSGKQLKAPDDDSLRREGDEVDQSHTQVLNFINKNQDSQ